MKIHLVTERFILRDLEELDDEGIFKLDSDPKVHTYLGNNPLTEISQARDVIQKVRKQYEDNGIGRWAVVQKSNNEFVGWAGIKYEWSEKFQKHYYDIGYRLKSNFWGQGIGSEVGLATLKYGLEEMKIKEIFAAAHVDNIASNKILQKIGFNLVDSFEICEELCNWYKIENNLLSLNS